MLRQFRVFTALIALLAAAGCGIKGPLVLPPPAATPTATPAPAPATGTDPATPNPAPAARKP